MFASNRDNLTVPLRDAFEIYLMDLDRDADGKPILVAWANFTQ